MEFIAIMWKPLLACFILVGIHAYLGLHVIKREVIFVDLSLAQIAALGSVIAVLCGLDLHDRPTYFFSLGATFLGAGIFAITRKKKSQIPQEAIIGIVYALATALVVLILHYLPEGDEHIRHILVGNILFVDTYHLTKITILYAIVGGVHWHFKKHFFAASEGREEYFRERKTTLKKWDFFFYMSFGIVVTSSVEISGVLMVFCFLIIPSIAAMLFHEDILSRLFFGWSFGFINCVIGIALSYFADLPTGSTIICTFGIGLILLSLFKKIIRNFN